MGITPLVIDLDGTLLNSDLLMESGLAFLKKSPLLALAPFKWISSGKAHLKTRLALSAPLDVSVLPYNKAVIALAQREKTKGRMIVLATASHHSYAEQIAEHLGFFDRVLATNASTNLSAHKKRDLLVAEYGEQGFDYVGNSKDDLPVWKAARRAYVINASAKVTNQANRHGNVESVMADAPVSFKVWLKALRLHQWMKNLLIFVPLLAGHKLLVPDLLFSGLIAFICFGLCASSVYVLNDLLDLEDDRHHRSKKHRPFASGELSITTGLLIFPLLLGCGLGGAALFLPLKFLAILLIYYALTLAYSFALKRQMVMDVIALAALYTLRIIAGAFAFSSVLTFWMLAFSMFIFLSLALVKRYAELKDARDKGQTQKARGRGYYPDDLEMIASLGAASGYLSVMVLALYIQDQATTILYRQPQIIWLACPLLLFWVTRIWMLTHRGQMHDDPVVFAVKDKGSLVVGVLFACVFWLAA